ncbi:hypothetical protein RYX36_027926 [Vicia faba]
MASSSTSPILLIIIFSTCLLFSYSESTEYIAGDTESSWKVNFPSRDALIDWATRHQFTYSDTVVNEDEDEDDCNTKIHSKLGDMVVTKRPLFLPPLITLPLSPSPAPAPNSSGAAAGRGFIVLLEVSLAMLMFLIWL